MRACVSILFGLACLAPVVAQEPASTDVAALLQRLRATKPTDPERGPLLDAILAAGDRAPVALFEQLDLDARPRELACRRHAERLVRAFERQADKVFVKRLDVKVKARIELLRGECQQRSRAEPLTKETIVGELDPRLRDLRELLSVSVDGVLAVAPTLAADVETFRLECRALVAVCAQRQRALTAARAGAHPIHDRPLPPATHERELDVALARLAKLATPMTARDARVLRANEAVTGLDPQEVAGILDLNFIRIVLGLPALAIDPKLCDAARDHSVDMVKLQFFSHQSPVPGKESFGARAARAGTSASGENIAAGQADGAGAIAAWWHSPGHHKNMLGGHARVGLGRHERTWTQLFGG